MRPCPFETSKCAKNGIFFKVFPMFVPSLSWQNDRLYIQMAQKCRLGKQMCAHSDACPTVSLSWQSSSSYNRAVAKTLPALAHRGIGLSDGYRRVLLPEQGQRSSLAPRLERVLVNQACCQSRGNPADRQSDRSADTDNRKEILPIEPEERR